MAEQDVHGDENSRNIEDNSTQDTHTGADRGVAGHEGDAQDVAQKDVANDQVTSSLNGILDDAADQLKKEEDKEVLSLQDFLERGKKDDRVYINAHDRLVRAIGEPHIIDTSKSDDPREKRIYQNGYRYVYDAFKNDFFGRETEEAMHEFVQTLKSGSWGTETKNQIPLLVGPPGASKSQAVKRVKKLYEKEHFYALAYEGENGVVEVSPVFDNPLNLFDTDQHGQWLQDEYGIPAEQIGQQVISAWASQRIRDNLAEGKNSLDNFKVVKMHPSERNLRAIARVEAGDEKTQDVSDLVGKVDVSQMEEEGQAHPDSYSFTGGLNIGNRGILEFVEALKASDKLLHPLLTAPQEGEYTGAENIGSMPFEGIVVMHSNESEVRNTESKETLEGFLDRIIKIEFPYNLQMTEEAQIYQKMMNQSTRLKSAPIAPGTLETLAEFAVMTRISQPLDNRVTQIEQKAQKSGQDDDHRTARKEAIKSKMIKARTYDGQDFTNEYPNSQTYGSYKQEAHANGEREGMHGISTRFNMKALEAAFRTDPHEISADPIDIISVLQKKVQKDPSIGSEDKSEYQEYLTEIKQRYLNQVDRELRKAAMESFESQGQSLFDRYIYYAELWADNDFDHPDPDSGRPITRDDIENELKRIEGPAGVADPKEFRYEMTRFVSKRREKNNGENPHWKESQRIKDVIESKLIKQAGDITELFSDQPASTQEGEDERNKAVKRLEERGYTTSQIRKIASVHRKEFQPS